MFRVRAGAFLCQALTGWGQGAGANIGGGSVVATGGQGSSRVELVKNLFTSHWW